MTFGQKLKEARQKAALSQEELAQRISVSRSAIAKWETDKGLPDVDNLKAISKLLDVSVDYLLDDENGLDLSITREPIDFKGEKSFIKKAKLKDALVKNRFPEYTIYALTATKKLSSKEKLRDHAMSLFTAFLPGSGSFDSGTELVNAFENLNNAFYLADSEKKQYFIAVDDEFMEIRQIATRIDERKFEIGDYKLTRSSKAIV